MQILLHVLGNKTSFIDSQGCSNLCAVEVLLNSLIRLELTLFLLVSFLLELLKHLSLVFVSFILPNVHCILLSASGGFLSFIVRSNLELS